MKIWTTRIYAISPETNEMTMYGGPNIPAFTKKLAREYCDLNGLGYCHIGDELVKEVPCKNGTFEPDFEKSIDYEDIQYN